MVRPSLFHAIQPGERLVDDGPTHGELGARRKTGGDATADPAGVEPERQSERRADKDRCGQQRQGYRDRTEPRRVERADRHAATRDEEDDDPRHSEEGHRADDRLDDADDGPDR